MLFGLIACRQLKRDRGLADDASEKGNALTTIPYYNTPDFTPQFISAADSVAALVPHTIGNFSLVNQDSIRIDEAYVAGKIHVANFMFTSCGSICPAMTAEMARVAAAYDKNPEVALLSYSVTPWIDNPARLRRFREVRQVSRYAHWQFLTGDKAAIYELARRSYFAEEELGFTRDSADFLHTEHLVLVDGGGRIRGIYNGTLALETEQLIKDIAVLLEEKKMRRNPPPTTSN